MQSILKMRPIAVICAFFACSTVHAASSSIPASCQSSLNHAFPGWHYAPVPERVKRLSREQHFNPAVIATGDYNGDGRRDWAVLLEHEGARKVVACLMNSKGPNLKVIDQPYCDDYIATSRAKSQHYNYESQQVEIIKNDGISTSCFESAGATYVFERGAIRRIVDSD